MVTIDISRPFRLVLGGVLAIAALIIITMIMSGSQAKAGSDGTQGASSAGFPPARAESFVASEEAMFARHFELFRSEATGIPADSIITDTGLERSSARAIVPLPDGALRKEGANAPSSRLWVASRSDGTACLLAQPSDAQGPAELCASSEEASNGYLFMTQSRSASEVELYGMLPDGIDTVTVTFRDATGVTIPVTSNAYAAKFNRPTASISFVDSDGVKHELPAGIDG